MASLTKCLESFKAHPPSRFDYLRMAVFVLTSLFIFVSPLPLTSFQELFFYSAAVLAGIWLIFDKTEFQFITPITAACLLFLLWCVVGLFFALNLQNSIHDIFAHLIKPLVFLWLVFNVFSSRRRLTFLLGLYVTSVCFLTYGGMIYFYGIQGHPILERFTTPLYRGYLDFAYVPAVIFAIYLLTERGNIFYKCWIAFSLLGACTAIVLTQSRATIIALAAVLAILFAFQKKKRMLIAVVMCGILLVLIFAYHSRYSLQTMEESKTIRLSAIVLFTEMLKDHPISGIGFGMETYYSRELLDAYNQKVPIRYHQSDPVAMPHNTFLDIAVRTGLVGLAIYLLLCFKLFKTGWGLIRRSKEDDLRSMALVILASFIAFFIQAMFGDTQFGVQTFVFHLLCGIMMALWRLDWESELPRPIRQ